MTKKRTAKRKTATRAPSRGRVPEALLPADVKGGARVTSLRAGEIDALRDQVERTREGMISRWNANPDDVQRSVAQLVLALVEFLRQLLERQAIRRMEAETLSADEIERIGLALMRLEETVHDLAARFGLSPDELNLDLGPLGRLT